MKTIKSYFTKTFGKYMAKWQAGFFITTPCLYLFTDVLQWPHWATVIGFQFIGALVFWPIDTYIFSKKKDD